MESKKTNKKTNKQTKNWYKETYLQNRNRLTKKTNKVIEGDRRRRDKLGVLD